LHQLAFAATKTTTPTIDPAALAVAASAIASTQAMTSRLLHQLAGHTEQIAPDLTAARIGRELRNSADAAETAYERWLSVREGLRGGRGLVTRGLGVPMRVEANNLTLAIGRLIHTDPQWEPHVGGRDDIRPPDEIAPTPTSLGDVCAGLHRLNAVHALTANRHGHLVHAMAQGGQCFRQDGCPNPATSAAGTRQCQRAKRPS
jgi:hypothetical protein